MIARNGNALVGELITHNDLIPTTPMIHSELHKALQGPEYTSVSLGIADPQGNAQTISKTRENGRNITSFRGIASVASNMGWL